MGKGALRPFFKGHSLKKEKEHEKKEVDKMLSHFVTLPFLMSPKKRKGPCRAASNNVRKRHRYAKNAFDVWGLVLYNIKVFIFNSMGEWM